MHAIEMAACRRRFGSRLPVFDFGSTDPHHHCDFITVDGIPMHNNTVSVLFSLVKTLYVRAWLACRQNKLRKLVQCSISLRYIVGLAPQTGCVGVGYHTIFLLNGAHHE